MVIVRIKWNVCLHFYVVVKKYNFIPPFPSDYYIYYCISVNGGYTYGCLIQQLYKEKLFKLNMIKAQKIRNNTKKECRSYNCL